MPVQPTCPQCGASLGAEVPGQLCLRCLLGLGLKRSEPEDDNDTMPATEEQDDFPGYRILGKIGEGGCGVVYRAEQSQPVRRQVAIKVIKLGMDTRSVVARFEAERQALALMEHPYIARVFDAGATGRGRPFFVMELIEGEHITEYCDQNGLPVPRRLDLFLQVCEAVRHAHLKGVIHRDLKPSNILVARVDGHPVCKVIDFGVAKATGRQRLADQTIYTAFDQFVGTPAYMSPEQAGLECDDIDGRSDVYSLGVLLYELLTGRPPFEPERLRRAAIDEICRIIREEDPVLPSARLTTLAAEELRATARLRLCPAHRLAGELYGDLDGIVMKALEKNRDRRYDTAGELAADILRHLHHEPVSARPPGALYRFWKFARRNRLAVMATVLVAASLLGGLALASWMYAKEARARGRLEHRAYLSDMSSAARMAALPVGGLAGAVNLLEAWRRHPPGQRGWEWHFLSGQCRHDLLTIRADAAELWSVAWSPDGKRLATGGSDGCVKIWDAEDGRQLSALRGHTARLSVVAWSPDGRWLVSTGEDKSIRLWDVESESSRSLDEHGATTVALAWSPDGRLLASGSVDGTAKIQHSATGAVVRVLTAKSQIRAVCWSPDGTRLYTCGAQGISQAWDAGTGQALWSTDPQAGAEQMAVACSPDGRELATGGTDNAVNFRDTATGTNLASLYDNQNIILSIAWAPDGKRLATTTLGDGRIAIRDASSGGRVTRVFRGHLGSVRAVVWRPDGARIASASADGTVKIWDAIGHNPSVRTLLQPDQAIALAWSPDGTKLAVGSRRTDAWIRDFTKNGAPVALDGGFTPWTVAVAWNQNGSRLATAGTNGLKVWDPSTRAVAWQDADTAKNLRSLAWSPQGRQLAAVSGNGKLVVWDAATGHPAQSLALPTGGTGSMAWSPDGTTIATGVGASIHLWDKQLRPLQILSGHREGINCLAWSPDGTRLASAGGDTSVKVWETRGGRVLHTLLGHGAPVHGLAWSPDGTRLATGSWDMSIKIWDTSSGIEVCSFDKPAGIVQMIKAVAWSPDGRRIAVSDIEGCIGILDATPGWLGKSGAPNANADDPAGRQAAAEFIRSHKLYCETVEPHVGNDADALRRLAWLRATSPYPEVRDGRKALDFATRANQWIGGRNPGILNILAAAHAECGDFPRAIAVQKQAIGLVSGAESRAQFSAALKLYESGRPYRDDAW